MARQGPCGGRYAIADLRKARYKEVVQWLKTD
jgi:hypothetical protein